MTTILRQSGLEASTFQIVRADEPAVADRNVVLPLQAWLARRQEYAGRTDVGVWLDAGEDAEVLGDDIATIPVIALNFPTFADGRSLSNAVVLRRHFGYTGEIRAIGDVRVDQVEQMQRCGFDAFALADGQDLARASRSLTVFSTHYQSSTDHPGLLDRRARGDLGSA